MRIFGLIGRSLIHSFSQAYFSQKFSQLQLADYSYKLFELADASEFPQLLARYPNLAGLNVTIPYKEQLWPYLAELAPSAKLVGAVNVIEVRADGSLVGHNTDYVGFREALRPFYPHRGGAARALVLGTGGAAKAVGVALQELDIAYQVVSRQPAAGQLSYEELTPPLLADNSLIINTSPLGTYPKVDECPPLPYAALTDRHYLFDLVYNPSETLFLQRGRAAGAQIKNGSEMLELQAEAAWAIWNQL
ncbi:shikimate dehydrogenase [Hymenobacter sp. UV11]|uniref:shikimate dehydrogenase family protein n=1 Tax=Hymenobacter sp. UV11 TaxID=1849735 RepID=UPI0010613EB4|nr:shikimate dehydrogenase [Hymenobacter sp. UV11]TDN38997.1 shikimate dehydrogenase [Hymenobacter sp. UV11]TFZ65919.1 shikimate dehydrogenase [Hymenobacter sp. UV11]